MIIQMIVWFFTALVALLMASVLVIVGGCVVGLAIVIVCGLVAMVKGE
ncbi:hypothetical protein [Weissella tructae]